MLPNTWAQAVLKLLDIGNVPISRISSELGVARAITHRHLHGARSPDAAMVQEINTAVARVVSAGDDGLNRRLADYLGSVMELGVGTKNANEIMREGAIMALQMFSNLFINDSIEDVLAVIDSVDVATRKKLLSALDKMARRVLLSDITWEQKPKPNIEQIISIFTSTSIDIEVFLKPQPMLEVECMNETLVLEVRAAIAKINCTNYERWEMQQRILSAHWAIERKHTRELIEYGKSKYKEGYLVGSIDHLKKQLADSEGVAK